MSVLLETKELDSLLTMSSMCLGAQLAVSRILKNLFKVIGSLYMVTIFRTDRITRSVCGQRLKSF